MTARRPAHTRAALIAVMCSALASSPAAWAQSPVIALSDMVNQDSAYAERELPRRGYVFIHADQRGNKVWQYWWQNNERVCARVAHVDGRATSIVSATPTDCNQYQQYSSTSTQGSGSGTSSSSVNPGVAVAVAAAAIVGVAALAHRSHERDESKHSSDQQVAEYERGYRDGLYHQGYHDYNRSQSYVDGYNAGQQKREAETSYRSPRGYHSGNAPYAQVNDLVGSAAGAYDGFLRQRGFVAKGGYQSGGQTYATWWNAGTRQCVQAVIYGGRVQNFNSLYEGNCT